MSNEVRDNMLLRFGRAPTCPRDIPSDQAVRIYNKAAERFFQNTGCLFSTISGPRRRALMKALWLEENPAQTTSLVAIVADWSDRIKNGRTDKTVLDSLESEVLEFREEVLIRTGEIDLPAGPDGIFGEAVDIIACALDAIRRERPTTSIADLEREVADYLNRKCQKWADKYS